MLVFLQYTARSEEAALLLAEELRRNGIEVNCGEQLMAMKETPDYSLLLDAKSAGRIPAGVVGWLPAKTAHRESVWATDLVAEAFGDQLPCEVRRGYPGNANGNWAFNRKATGPSLVLRFTGSGQRTGETDGWNALWARRLARIFCRRLDVPYLEQNP